MLNVIFLAISTISIFKHRQTKEQTSILINKLLTNLVILYFLSLNHIVWMLVKNI
jgi:hypothetical protein